MVVFSAVLLAFNQRKKREAFFFGKSVILCVGGLVPGPGPWSGSGAAATGPISQVEVRTCVTPRSENTEEQISPHWPSHRPLCSALSADRGDRGGVSTGLTVRCSHHGYAATYVRTHAPTAPPVRARATSLYISVSFHRVGGGGCCWDTTGSRFYHVLYLQTVKTLFITVWVKAQFLFPHRRLQTAGLKTLLISGRGAEVRHDPPPEHGYMLLKPPRGCELPKKRKGKKSPTKHFLCFFFFWAGGA